MQDLSLHILDIVENSATAGAKNVEIKVIENVKKNLLTIEVIDDGTGMDNEFSKKAIEPFVTSRKERKVGLGLSLFAQAASMSNGHLSVSSNLQDGTKVRAVFEHSHIDRKPLGDMEQTIMTLVTGYPHINFLYVHRTDGKKFMFDSQKLRRQLNQPLSSSAGLKILRTKLKEDIQELFDH